MRQDERTPLSKSKLQKRLIEADKAAAVNAFVPLLFVTLLAAGLTAIICKFFPPAPPLFRFFLVICTVPFWVGVAILLRRALIAIKRYRSDLAEDLLRIETDTVNTLTEEFPSFSSRSQSKVYVVYLTKHGRCTIDSTLWCILHEGDEVHVAVIQRERPEVCGVYSMLTHKFVED